MPNAIIQTASKEYFQPSTVKKLPSIQPEARSYLDRGYCPIANKYRTKKPSLRGWTQPGQITADNIDEHFTDESNIGILLGDASGGLVDIDIDAPDGYDLASYFFPPTSMRFGRLSHPSSHWIYKVPQAQTIFVTREDNHRNIVEVRANGHQTIFPPSIHPTGETIEFEENGEPGESTWGDLIRAAKNLSFAIILRNHWNSGSRHRLSLAISGYLAICGWPEEDVQTIISIVAEKAKDEEIDDRLTCVKTSFERFRANQVVAGPTELEALLGPCFVEEFDRWFGRNNRSLAVLPNSAGLSPTIVQDQHNALSSDIDLSEYLATLLCDKLSYCGTVGRWFRRNKQVWVPVTMTEIEGEIKEKLTALANKVAPIGMFISQRRTLLTTNKISSLEHLLRSHPTIIVDSQDFDGKSTLLGCSDESILDLDEKAKSTASGSIVTKKLGTKFDPTAKCHRWETFLNELFKDDTKLITFIQRAVGYTLTGLGSERCLFVLIGDGSNGKSTFLKVMLRLFGDYGSGVPMHTLMAGRYGNDKTDDLESDSK